VLIVNRPNRKLAVGADEFLGPLAVVHVGAPGGPKPKWASRPLLLELKNLRAFFNDAASAPAGRLVERNPFAKLGLRSSRGRRDTQPPSQAEIARFVALADELTPPSFAAYLDVAVHEGVRPGELDALRWDRIDFQAQTILVDQQWCAKTREFTAPKHGHARTIALTDRPGNGCCGSREKAILRSRRYAVRTTALPLGRTTGTGSGPPWASATPTFTTCTRHYFGWYALNVLGLPDHVIALQFGHRDGGKLVRTNYGHPDAVIARERIREAFRQAPAAPVPLAPPSARGRYA
jgi:integrase